MSKQTITPEELAEQFKPRTKFVEVEAWSATVEIRQLTIAEENHVQSLVLDDSETIVAEDGNLQSKVKYSDISAATIQAVSYALVAPKMKVAELEELGKEALAGVNEIKAALDNWAIEGKSQEAESSSSESPKSSAKQSKSSKSK